MIGFPLPYVWGFRLKANVRNCPVIPCSQRKQENPLFSVWSYEEKLLFPIYYICCIMGKKRREINTLINLFIALYANYFTRFD